MDACVALKRNLCLNTLLFEDDQIIIQNIEDKIQKHVYILNQLSKDHTLKISTDKTKIVVFKGEQLLCSKIEIDWSLFEKVKQFNYLGSELSLDGELDFDRQSTNSKE